MMIGAFGGGIELVGGGGNLLFLGSSTIGSYSSTGESGLGRGASVYASIWFDSLSESLKSNILIPELNRIKLSSL